MISWKTTQDKNKYESVLSTLSSIMKGMDLNLNNINLELKNEITDLNYLSERLLLLSRISQYLSLIQGHSLELQKNYKTGELYGIYERISELNRSVRMEGDAVRSVLSTQKTLIDLK